MEVELELRALVAHSVIAADYTIREEMLNGKTHLVVPVIMMVEGVHNGSAGPVYHKEDELTKFTEAWNGIPVTISHPEEDGQNISANSPSVLNSTVVGRIFNTVYRGGLRAEAWLDLERLTEVSPEALDYIRHNRPLDVSVGVYSDSETIEGEWGGETYEAIARNYRPDHLALLPGETGACSWSDGCGIRNNKKGGKVDDLLKSFREFSLKGYAVIPITNEAGFQEISSLLQGKLNAMDTNSRMFFLEEVFLSDFVYRVRDIDGGSTLYRRGYSVNNGEVELAENSVEVRKQVDFVTMEMVRTTPSNNNNNKGGKMANEGKSPCCEAKVDALIANKQTHWTAKDKEYLLTQEESVIDKMSPKEAPKVEAIEVNTEEVLDTFKQTLKTIDDYTALMPETMKAQVDGGVKLYKEHRDTLVKGILDNTADDVWKKEVLEAMDDSTLESISKSVKQPVDYSGQGAGGGQPVNGETVEIPVEYRERKEDK